MREVGIRLPSELLEDFEEQGGGGDAVDIVIAKDDKGFIAFARLEKTVHGGGHVGEEKRVGEVFEARLEEIRDVLGVAESAIHEAFDEERGDFEGVGELSGQEGLWRGDCPTKFHRFGDYAGERGLKTKMRRIERKGMKFRRSGCKMGSNGRCVYSSGAEVGCGG